MKYIFCIISFVFYAFAADIVFDDSGVFISSLSSSELQLYSDSTSASNWNSYGLTLLIHGWPQMAGVSLERARRCEEHTHSHLSHRALAAYYNSQGNTQQAVEELSPIPSDTYTQVMLAFLLQESSNLVRSDSLIKTITWDNSTLHGLEPLLSARQLRLSGYTEEASLVLQNSLLADSITEMVRDLYYLELLQTDGLNYSTTPESFIRCINADLVLSGGVYLAPLLSFLETLSDNPAALLARSRILSIFNRHEEAMEIIPPGSDCLISVELSLRKIELLIHLDMLNEAMDEVNELLERDSTDSRILEMQGILLLRGAKYHEAFLEMQSAGERTGSAGCIALQGLAAELAGHSSRAIESYAPLLESNADSIIVINRMRRIVLNTDPQCVLNSEREEYFTNHSLSGLSGNFSISYYSNTGEYQYSSISIRAKTKYKYGFYGSNISANGMYSFNRWPDSELTQTTISTSLVGRNHSSSRFFQQLMLDWEKRRYTYDRNRFEASAGLGYRFDLLSSLKLTPYLGFGKSKERLETDAEELDHWIITPEVNLVFLGFSIHNLLPTINLSGSAARNLDDSGGYELSASAMIDCISNRLYSFSVGYDIFESYQPEADYRCTNKYTYIMLTLKF